MTTDAHAITAPVTISGTGPYVITDSYIEAVEIAAGIMTGVDFTPMQNGTDFFVAAEPGPTGGTLTISAQMATDHDGATLHIWRATDVEQAWAGSNGREKAVESQMDWLTRSVQNLQRDTARTVRFLQPVNPIGAVPSHNIGFDDTGALIARPDEVVSTDLAATYAADAQAAATVAANSVPIYELTTVQLMLADTGAGYNAPSARIVSPGDVIKGGAYRYLVAASTATDHDLTTAGGVKLYVLMGQNGRYSVYAFGAVGNGVTDDHAAIQAAIDALQPRHATLELPAGVFLVSADLVISDVADDFEICGVGCGEFVNDNAATTIKASGSATSIFRLQYSANTTYGIKWTDLRLDGDGIATDGIRADNFFPAGRLTRVSIDNVDYGVSLYESCWGWHFNEVYLRASTIGFDLRDKNHNACLVGCVTRSVSGSTPASGLRVGTTASSSSITCLGCDFEMDAPSTAQIFISQARGFTLSGCYLENRGSTQAINLGDAALANRVDGVSITGSHFQKDTGAHAITCHNVEGVHVSGNHFTGGTSFDVNIDPASTYNKNVLVIANRYSSNGGMADADFAALNRQTLTQATAITANLDEGVNLYLDTAADYANPIDLALNNDFCVQQQGGVLTYYVNNSSAGANDFTFNANNFANVAAQNLTTGQTCMFVFVYVPALAKFVELNRSVT